MPGPIKGVIYTNYVPRGATVNGDYIIKALKSFLKALRLKRPDLEPGEWMFHWVNAPVHATEKVQRFLAKKKIQVIHTPPTHLTWPLRTISSSPL